MAKSTQFGVPVVGWLMRHVCVFPVRRFQVDPQAARYALRLLEAGEAVAVYIEGERSWNRKLQPPRRGTARLALRTAAPTVLCAISGTYDAWPRWDRRPRPAPVHIRFTPIDLPTLRGDENRLRARDTAHRIMDGLAESLAHIQDR
jgi:1-acyl-sn-glycerol-3-phosphate acyltransferase